GGCMQRLRYPRHRVWARPPRARAAEGGSAHTQLSGSPRLVRVDYDSARVRRRRLERQRGATSEDSHPFPDGSRIDEEVQLVDQVILDERGDEARAAVDDDVLAAPALQPIHRFDQRTI